MKKPLPKNAEPYKFKPGQSGNPLGARLHKPLKKITHRSLKKVLRAVLKGNLKSLERIIKDERSTVLEVAVASAIAKAIRTGDYGTTERIIERIVGKIPDKIDINSKVRSIQFSAKAKISKDMVRQYVDELEKEV